MRNVRSHDGLVHIVYTQFDGDVDIITMCTTKRWTGRTIDHTSPNHVEHVDDAATCIECVGRSP